MWISSLNSNILLTNKAIGSPSKRLHCALVGLHSTPFVVVQSLSCCVQFFATPWPATHQVSLSFTISQSLLKFMSIESVMQSTVVLCSPLLLLLNLSQPSGSFPMSWLFTSGGQSSPASASAAVLPMSIQG